MISNLIFAAIGGVLVYFLRNDTKEFGLNGRAHWILMTLAVFVYALIFQHPFMELWRYGAALTVFAAMLTVGHSMILSDPRIDKCPVKPDFIEKPLMQLFNKTPLDVVGVPLYLAYGVIRYVAPCALIGHLIGNDFYALAGAITVIGYWPIAYWVTGGEKTKFVGAAICGVALFGMI